MLRNLFIGVAVCICTYVATFQDAYAIRTAKHIKIAWTDEEAIVNSACNDFYRRAISNNFDKGESINDVSDYIGMLNDCIENLTYEHPNLNDRMKRSKFESWIFLFNSLLTNKNSNRKTLSY